MSGQVVEQWPLKSLAEVAEIISGQSPRGEFYNDSGDGLPFYQGKKEFQEKYIGSPTKWTSKTTKIAYEGDILMSVRAPVGPINFATQEICIGRGLAAIRVSEHMNRDFLFYQLLSKQNEISGKDGAVFPSINRAMIGEIRVVVPPLKEQQRIVSILDEAFEQIVITSEQVLEKRQDSKELFQSLLQDVMLGDNDEWQSESLIELSESLHQGLNTAGHKIKFFETGYPIIQTRNITNGVIDLEEKIKFVGEEDWNKYQEKYKPKTGDIFFTNIGTIGKTAVVFAEEDYLIHWNIFKIRPKKIIEPYFLKYTLDMLTNDGFFENKQKGGTVNFVTKKMMSEVVVNFPSLADQCEIVKLITLLEEYTQKLEQTFLRESAVLDELKQSILQEAFSGTLRNTEGLAGQS